jgi:hypothetical protein
MKKLRKKHGKDIRFFMCGEYGDKGDRPHYHLCVFNHDFIDKKVLTQKNGVKLYVSLQLQSLWPWGFSTIGDVTMQSAAYTARYCIKKITGEPAAAHYGKRIPEYANMSRRPGIGQSYYQKFKTDIITHDKMVMRNNLISTVPKYYDKIHEIEDPHHFQRTKACRKKQSRPDNNTWERLAVREEVQKQKAKNLKREIES